MEYLRQTYNGNELNKIFTLPLALRNRTVDVIVLPADEPQYENPKAKRQLGFMPGLDIPDSFFEPLPEEELQAWGL